MRTRVAIVRAGGAKARETTRRASPEPAGPDTRRKADAMLQLIGKIQVGPQLGECSRCQVESSSRLTSGPEESLSRGAPVSRIVTQFGSEGAARRVGDGHALLDSPTRKRRH